MYTILALFARISVFASVCYRRANCDVASFICSSIIFPRHPSAPELLEPVPRPPHSSLAMSLFAGSTITTTTTLEPNKAFHTLFFRDDRGLLQRDPHPVKGFDPRTRKSLTPQRPFSN